jgi:signal transduction histidine kinase
MKPIYTISLLFFHLSVVGQKAHFNIERIVVNGQEINSKSSEKIVLKSAQNNVLIEGTNLSSDSATYLYRLVGYDSVWVLAHYPVAQYQNLVGGQYEFEIKAKSGSYITTPARFGFEVEDSILERPWFWPSIAVYVLFLIGIGIYFFSLYDLRQKLKVQNIRNRIAADLHDEVGSNLNSIAIFVELLRKKAPANLTEILDKITNNSVESVQLMQDTIWAIQAKNDDITKFVARMNNFATEVLAAKAIALDFMSELPNKAPNLPMEQRKDMYLIFKEAINNIAKHSKATKANVKWKMNNEQCTLIIIDNGRGFDTAQVNEGNGLNNFMARAEASEMRVNVSSEIGKGTTVEVLVLL